MDQIYSKIVEMVEKPTWKSLLIDTVKSSGIDPWDIDVSLLASKFAEKIKKMKEMNLRVPANAILASSILLRFKSDNWIFFPNQLEEEPIEENGKEDLGRPEIPELPPVKRITRRRVTLDDLIRAIEEVMEKEIKRKKKRERPRIELDPLALLKTSFNDESEFQDQLRLVWIALNQKMDENGLVLLSDLLAGKSRQDLIKVLLPLLHLANDDKVFLWQEDYFDEIIIKVNANARGD